MYTATDEVWKEYEADTNPTYLSHVVYPPRGTLMQAFELRNVYKPHHPSSVARLELVSSTQLAHCFIDAIESTLLSLLMGDRFAHFTVGGIAPLHSKHTTYIPIASKLFTVGAWTAG
jgi:hypothetical protein